MEPTRIGALMPVATEKLALVPQGSRQLKTIDHEDSFGLAVNDQRLAQTGEPGLKNALQYVFALVGLRSVPVGPEKEFLAPEPQKKCRCPPPRRDTAGLRHGGAGSAGSGPAGRPVL